MLEDMYPQAVEAGIPSTEYWSMTLEEVLIQVNANKKRHENELREKAMLDYSQQRMAIFAFNDPKNFPEFEKVYPFLANIRDEVSQAVSEEEQRKAEMKRDQDIMLMNAAAIKATRERKHKK